jgi:hypothetical protein
VPPRLLKALLGAVLAALVVLGAGAPAGAAKPRTKAPACPPVTVRDSTKAAMAVFSGTVNDVQKGPRTDGQQGALYTHTVTVDMVYQGNIDTETVTVETDRNRAGCSLGALAVGTEYMFFVTGTGEPWVASGTSGTRPSNETVVAQVERLLGPGSPPIQPTPETAVFTPVDLSEPPTFAQLAWPGAALVVVGLLGLLVVRALSRRSPGY